MLSESQYLFKLLFFTGNSSLEPLIEGLCAQIHVNLRLSSCKMGIDPLGDHVLTYKQHTGSICGHNQLMDVVACLSRDSKIGPVRVNHKV